jgi:hypothetical protein
MSSLSGLLGTMAEKRRRQIAKDIKKASAPPTTSPKQSIPRPKSKVKPIKPKMKALPKRASKQLRKRVMSKKGLSKQDIQVTRDKEGNYVFKQR